MLSTWPNNGPETQPRRMPFLTLAKSGKTTLHQVLGLRGVLPQYVRGDKKLNDGEVAKVSELVPLLPAGGEAARHRHRWTIRMPGRWTC